MCFAFTIVVGSNFGLSIAPLGIRTCNADAGQHTKKMLFDVMKVKRILITL